MTTTAIATATNAAPPAAPALGIPQVIRIPEMWVSNAMLMGRATPVAANRISASSLVPRFARRTCIRASQQRA